MKYRQSVIGRRRTLEYVRGQSELRSGVRPVMDASQGPTARTRLFAGVCVVAAVLVVLVGGCSQSSADGESAGPGAVTTAPAPPAQSSPSNVEPPHRPPEDFCDLVDYSAASVVFGDPIPSSLDRTTISEDDTLRCVESFFGIEDPAAGRLPGGAAIVHISILDSESAAIEAFEGVAIYATVPPFPGGGELSADQLQFRQSSEAVYVELRVENLFVEVKLQIVPARFDDLGPLASEAPAATAAIARSVLQVLSETE
jgi:hypothetical protein